MGCQASIGYRSMGNFRLVGRSITLATNSFLVNFSVIKWRCDPASCLPGCYTVMHRILHAVDNTISFVKLKGLEFHFGVLAVLESNPHEHGLYPPD